MPETIQFNFMSYARIVRRFSIGRRRRRSCCLFIFVACALASSYKIFSLNFSFCFYFWLFSLRVAGCSKQVQRPDWIVKRCCEWHDQNTQTHGSTSDRTHTAKLFYGTDATSHRNTHTREHTSTQSEARNRMFAQRWKETEKDESFSLALWTSKFYVELPLSLSRDTWSKVTCCRLFHNEMVALVCMYMCKALRAHERKNEKEKYSLCIVQSAQHTQHNIKLLFEWMLMLWPLTLPLLLLILLLSFVSSSTKNFYQRFFGRFFRLSVRIEAEHTRVKATAHIIVAKNRTRNNIRQREKKLFTSVFIQTFIEYWRAFSVFPTKNKIIKKKKLEKNVIKIKWQVNRIR